MIEMREGFMTLFAKDFRKYAREALKEYWKIAILTGIIVVLLGGESIEVSNGIELVWHFESGISIESVFMKPYMISIKDRVYVFLMLYLIFKEILHLIFGGVISLGYAKFNLSMIDKTEPKMIDIFSQFHRFGSTVCLTLLRKAMVIFWSLLFLIPGIIASLNYSMAHYILFENPEMTAMEALRESKMLIKGHRFKLLCLKLSFLGWEILSIVTLGLGDLIIRPYAETSIAVFYREIVKEKESLAFP